MLSAAADGGDGAGDSDGAGPGPQRLSWLSLAVGSSGCCRASSTTRLEWLDPEDTERPRLGSCGADNLADVETVLDSVLCCCLGILAASSKVVSGAGQQGGRLEHQEVIA